MKHDLTTGTWQDDTGCPISIILVSTSDVGITLRMPDTAGGGGYMGIQEETPDPEAVVKICRLLED